jgi:hypothetical protein
MKPSDGSSNAPQSGPKRTPWWECATYVITALLFVLYFGVFWSRSFLPSETRVAVESLIGTVGFPFFVVSMVLIVRRRRPGLWSSLTWWERIIYVLASVLGSLALLLNFLGNSLPLLPDNWLEAMPVSFNFLTLGDISTVFLGVAFPFILASMLLSMQRLNPEKWSGVQRLWSFWIALVGATLFTIGVAWYSIRYLIYPLYQLPFSQGVLIFTLIIIGVAVALFGSLATMALGQTA